MEPMEKAFVPAEVEPRWRARWDELQVGIADVASERPAFTIALPPPNITAELHLGHAAGFSVQDALARYHRMAGDEVEWCPGTDHAAIATNAVIERQLALEGLTKGQIGREAFLERVDAWYRTTGGRILEQMRQLGFTLDWSRTRFTLDDAYVRSIRAAFKSLYDDGLVYRGPRIVNWCPHDRSAISDEEVRWEEHADSLVRLSYPVVDGPGDEPPPSGGRTITVATVRPETMLGDTGVAVAPGDPRYRDAVGRWAVLPLTGRHVPIFEDEAVEPQFGTGALKVTPGHDPTDYEIGRRHGLPVVTVIGPDGKMDVPGLPRFHGIPAEVARDLVTQALRDVGAVAGAEEYVHDVGHCDRCGSVLEPLVSEQWWVRMRELAGPGIDAVERGAVRFHPERPHTGVYLDWMRNIRDWCISRQIWLGHRVPVATCASGHRFAWVDPPQACEVCGAAELTLDPDVLDTWFSSALWPFAIFGWPQRTPDLERFYPTQVLVTAREIIFLWVARMIMTGLHFMDAIPFGDVLINSTIQAADGSRMSKSRGNGVDPADMVERYGADAVRAWASAVGTAAQDMRFDENRIASYRLFANKLWNVTRLLVQRAGDGSGAVREATVPEPGSLRPVDRWLLARVASCAAAVGQAVEQFRFHDAMERLYDTVWHVFCDDYVEAVKPRLGDEDDPAAWVATAALDTLLRLLHPFMPFVTEECAQRLPSAAPTLQRRTWPQPPAWWREGEGEAAAVDAALELVGALRQARQEAGVTSSERLDATIEAAGALGVRELAPILASLARVRIVDATPDGATRLSAVATGGALQASLWVPRARSEDDVARLEGQRRDLETRVAGLRTRLAAPGFVEKARPDVVERARSQLAEAEGQLAAIERLLEGTAA